MNGMYQKLIIVIKSDKKIGSFLPFLTMMIIINIF